MFSPGLLTSQIIRLTVCELVQYFVLHFEHTHTSHVPSVAHVSKMSDLLRLRLEIL